MKRSGGKNNRELQDLKFTVNDQKSKLQELTSEHVELQHQNRKLQEMLKGEQQVNNSTMDCIKKELEYTTQECIIELKPPTQTPTQKFISVFSAFYSQEIGSRLEPFGMIFEALQSEP